MKKITIYGFLTTVLSAYLCLGNSGCGALPPSYSGIYELKDSGPETPEKAFFNIKFPKKIVVYQHPFESEHPGGLKNILSVGVSDPELRGLFFTRASLSREQTTHDSLLFDLAKPETVKDYSSDPLIEPDGKNVGPSCVYTYTADARFRFSPDSNALTNELTGAYPSKQLSNPKDPNSAYTAERQWTSNPINDAAWDSSKVALTVTYMATRRYAYGTFGLCTRAGILQHDERTVMISAEYVRVQEIDSGDLRRSDSVIHDVQVDALIKSADEAWTKVFDVPVNGSAYAPIFHDLDQIAP